MTNTGPVVTGQNTLAVSAVEGDSVSFPADFADDDPWDTHTVTIDWGDGTTDLAASGDDSGTGWAIGSHVYADDGVYNATLTVTGPGAPPVIVDAPNATAVDSATWRKIELRMPDGLHAGNEYGMVLLEPLSWIQQENTPGTWVATLEFFRLRGEHTRAMIEDIIQFRVRYPEVDQMGCVHHSRFLQYFEMGRVELLRRRGFSYADLEKAGVFFVVVKAEIKYRNPARYDDELQLTTRIARQGPVRIDHEYLLRRKDVVLAEGTTTIACVDRNGQIQQIPQYMA